MSSRPWIETRTYPSGKWYYIGRRDADGKKLPLISCGQVYSNAVEMRRRYEERQFQPNKPSEISVGDAVQLYLDWSERERRKRPSTLDIIRTHTKLFLETHGSSKLVDITEADLRNYKRQLVNGNYRRMKRMPVKRDPDPRRKWRLTSVNIPYSHNGINIRLVVLKAFFRWAHREEKLINSNPAETLAKLPEQEVGRALTPEEAQKLIKSARGKPILPALLGYLYTGLRFSELYDLEAENVRDGHIYIERVRNKTGKPKRVPIHKDVLGIFTARNKGRVFNYFKSKGGFRRAIWTVFKRAGLLENERLRIHDLRHTCASWLLQYGGLSMPEVSEILGHVNISTTKRYSHFEKSHLKARVDSFQLPIK